MQGSAHPTFDPLAGLRTAAAAREVAGLRRYLVPRVADDATAPSAASGSAASGRRRFRQARRACG